MTALEAPAFLPCGLSRTDEVDDADVAVSFFVAFFPIDALSGDTPFFTVLTGFLPLAAVAALGILTALVTFELLAFPVEPVLRLFVVAFVAFPTAFVFFAGLPFLALTFDLLVFVPFATVFAFPFAAFFGVIFGRTEAFLVAPFFFGLDLAATLAFFGLALVLAVPFLDTTFFAFTGFFDTALDFVADFFLDLGRALAFDLGLALAAMCHPPDRMIDNRPA